MLKSSASTTTTLKFAAFIRMWAAGNKSKPAQWT